MTNANAEFGMLLMRNSSLMAQSDVFDHPEHPFTQWMREFESATFGIVKTVGHQTAALNAWNAAVTACSSIDALASLAPAAVEGDAMPKRYTGEDMLARAAYMACQWEDNKPPQREKEVIDMLTQAGTDLLRVKDAEQPAAENTELHDDFPRSTNMSDVPELAEAISRSANDILVRALVQCHEALKHSKPEMAHYPEPVKRHRDAMMAAIAALNAAGVTPK